MPQEMKDKTCVIVGLAPSSRDLAFNEPDTVDLWTLNNAHDCFPEEKLSRFTYWFQVHERSEVENNNPPVKDEEESRHIAFLRSLKIPIYMEEAHPDIPHSLRYPRYEVVADLGIDYLTSSIAYMLAFAIYLHYTEIHMYGVDMSGDTEYVHERPCVEFLLGIAHARGIKVILPQNSPIMKGPLYATTVQIPSTLVKDHLRTYLHYKETEGQAYNEMVGEVRILEKLASAHPEDTALQELLLERTREREIRKGQYNAYCGASTALSELLIEAIRPVNDAQKALRAMALPGTNHREQTVHPQDTLANTRTMDYITRKKLEDAEEILDELEIERGLKADYHNRMREKLNA